jgi:hypothetical protein
MALSMLYPNLTDDEIAACRRSFQLLDLKNEGQIQTNELLKVRPLQPRRSVYATPGTARLHNGCSSCGTAGCEVIWSAGTSCRQ